MHVFCRECLANVINTPHIEDENEAKYKADERPCPVCRSAVSESKSFSRDAFEPTDADLVGEVEGASILINDSDEEIPDVSDVARGKGKAKAARKKRAVRRVLDTDDEEDEDNGSDDLSDFIVEDDEDEEEKDVRRALKKRLGKRCAVIVDSDNDIEDFPDEVVLSVKTGADIPKEKIKMLPRFLPSTKMKHMMETLHTWAKENPGEKTLIISQWTACLDLVSAYLTEKGLSLHVKYQGNMNRRQRDEAVRIFMSEDKAQVMLMSLKCGGVGLNLVRANRVISLDLAWSEAVENQAFDRVHRLGQMRNVFVQRLVIADTVEDRVLSLQEKKRNLADGSLGEGNGKKLGRLSVRELANLFGLDHRGRVLDQ